MEDKGFIGNALRGMAMGVAEVIPGVSGGTIAFITGIYERLIRAISGLSLDLIKTIWNEGFSSFWKKLDGTFLFQLASGMFVGLVLGIFGVSYLLETAPAPLWAFFFGLIAASVIYVFRQTDTTKASNWVYFIIATVIAYFLTSLSPAEGSTHALYVFISGAIAICALILPGISGSFILLLLGMYTIIVPTVKELLVNFSFKSLSTVSIFALGCLTGLLTFSRVLNYTFKYYREVTLAVLSGLMLGSLHKIWPWRNPVSVIDKTTGHDVAISVFQSDQFNDQYKLISEANVLPSAYVYEAMLPICVISFLVGFGLILIAMKYNKEM